jgi:hypothetical protein
VRLVPYAFGLVALATAALPFTKEGSTLATACQIVISLGVLYGIASPGLRKHGGHLLALLAVGLALQGCMPSMHRHPGPIGQPSPAACYAAKQARAAWLTWVEPYARQALEEQEAFSCQPLPVPPVTETP